MRDLRQPVGRTGESLCSIFGIDDVLIGAAVSAIGGAVSSKNNSKAADKAADSAAASAAANNALQRDIYNQNTANLSPFMVRGNAAGDSINALLGLPTNAQAVASGAYNPGGAAAGPDWGQYGVDNPDVAAEYQRVNAIADRNSPWFTEHGLDKGPAGFYEWHYNTYGRNEGRQAPTSAAQAQAQQQVGAQAAVDPTKAAEDAFKRYQESTGHQLRLQTGSDAISSNRTTAGLLKSGATLKALTKYGQDLGTGDFQTYLGNLSGQQNVGLSGANALAGVGQNYAGAVGANNDSAAGAAGNAALIGAANQNALMGQLASAAGSYGSSFGQSQNKLFSNPANVPTVGGYGGGIYTMGPRL